MKKLLFLTAAILLMASQVQAACVCKTPGLDYGIGAAGKYRLIFTCTADGTPGTCTDDVAASVMSTIGGMYLYTVTAYKGGTAPDEASLAITDSIGKSYLDASGNGATLIHASSTLWDYPDGAVGSENHYPLIHADRPLTHTITDQATNNAIMLIEYELIK